MDISRYFQEDTKEDCVRFIGEKLECFIPLRYQMDNFLKIGETIQALGVFALTINDTIEGGLQLPAVITMEPQETYEVTKDDERYLVCVFQKFDKVMNTLSVMQIEKIGYFLWREFLSLGHMPRYITYQNVATLMDDLKEVTGRGTGSNHAIMEIIYAHLFRDAKDLNVKYRHTDMHQPPAHVTLRDVSYGPSSTLARIAGSYTDTGINSALLNQADQNHELEDLFRS